MNVLPLCLIIIIIDVVIIVRSIITLVRNKNNQGDTHRKIKSRAIISLSISSLLLLVFMSLLGLAISESANNKKHDANSSSSSKSSATSLLNSSSSMSSKKSTDNHVSASDMKAHPQLSGAVITYYGVHMLKSSSWQALQNNMNDKFGIEVMSTSDATKYFINLGNQNNGIYYLLVGTDHDEVAFYDENNILLKKVSLNDVVGYVNDNTSESTINSIRDNVTVSVGNPKIDLVNDAQTDSKKYAEDIMAYVENENIADSFTYGLWHSIDPESLKKLYNGSYHVSFDGNSTYGLDTQSGGSAQFTSPVAGSVSFIGQGGVSAKPVDPEKLRVSVSTIEDVLNNLDASQFPDVTVSE